MEKPTDIWSVEQIKISELTLDNRNPRFPDRYRNAKQEELIHILINESDVLGLAKEIVERQNVPQWEKIFVMKEQDKNLVLEGNRRVSAYKCLLKPELAPQSYQEKFTALSKEIKFNRDKTLEVVIVPDRNAAAPIIESKHTNKAMKEWTAAMKDLFILRMNSGSAYPPKAINKARILQANLYTLATQLVLPIEIKKVVNDHNKFSVTNLYRVAGGALGKSFLDYKIDTAGNINPNSKIDFDKKFKKIVSDVATGEVSSRSWAQNKDKLKEYFSTFDIPGQKKPPFPTQPSSKSSNQPRPVEKPTQPVPQQPIVEVPVLPVPIIQYTHRNYTDPQVTKIIESLLLRFPEVVNQYKHNYKNSYKIVITQEYDVQYLLQGLLKLYFNDVKLEEWTPSIVGSSARMDIFLFQRKIAIEIKITKGSTTIKELGDAFIKDVASFKTHPDCKQIFFFVYDPSGLPNKQELITGIDKMSTTELPLKLIIAPF